MKKSALIALLLALVLLLTGCATEDEAAKNAREVIRLGDIVYTRGDVQEQTEFQLQYMQMLYAMYLGMNVDVTDPEMVASAQNAVIEGLTQQAVLTAKAHELGLDKLTAEEEAKLEEDAQATWKSYRDSVRSSLNLPEGTDEKEIEAAIDNICKQDDMTIEVVRETELRSLLNEKVRLHATKDVSVTEADVAAEYEARVAKAKEDYAANLSQYGSDVLGGSTVCYRPAGYRNARQILVQFEEADMTLLTGIGQALYEYQNAEAQYVSQLTAADVTNIDELVAQVKVELAPYTAPTADVSVASVTPEFVTAPEATVAQNVQTLAQLRALIAALTEQQTLATAQAAEKIAPEADEVLSALAAGESWEAVSAAHNDDPGMKEGSAFAATGYPICEGFAQFDPVFVEAAMGVKNVGEWSDKALSSSYGYYIIQYTSDVAEGAVPYAEVQEAIQKALLTTAQDSAYQAAVEKWVGEADVKVSLDALKD